MYEAEIFPSNVGTGIAYLTTKENFVVVNNYKNPRILRYARIPGEESISAWAVLSTKRQTSIVVARGSSLYSVDHSVCSPENLDFTSVPAQNSPIVSISVSMNGQHVAVFTESGVLWMGSSDFQIKYCEYSSGMRSRPKQIVW